MLDFDAASWQAAVVPLSGRQRVILGLERAWRTEAGSKRDPVCDRLGVSRARYSALLVPLLDSEDADPLLVRRLERLRDRRRRAPFQARPAEGPPSR